ncbi:MAG TPA: MmgE/PrpD family protein [Burkholderiales bacterium]|nr:MmgE/PrpD family protein [Burkholderiales bacterium]
MTLTSGPTRRLAEFFAAATWDDVPAHVKHEAKRSLVNYFACALGGCRDDAVEATSRVLRRFAGAATSTVIGRGERLDALSAAFVNAASANVFDFDDTHLYTVLHPTAPVAAALFALAEARRMSGRDLLLAFALGVEAECRVGNAVSPGHYRRGWHITSTCGVFGAAAAAGKVLGLDAERFVWALGDASAQAGGLLETLGTMAKSISVGNAARNGLAAAMYAAEGVFGPAEPLAGTYGFLRVTGNEWDASRLDSGLGRSWELASNTYKLYPVGIVLSPVIEACFALRERVDAAAIERVAIAGHPLLRERTDRVHPTSGREAQVSAQHAVAVVFARGRAGLAEFDDAAANDAALRPLREKVQVIDDARCPVESVTVSVQLRGGGTFTQRVESARGSSARPLTDDDLERKLRDLVEFGGSTCDVPRLIEAIWNIDETQDAGAITALASN